MTNRLYLNHQYFTKSQMQFLKKRTMQELNEIGIYDVELKVEKIMEDGNRCWGWFYVDLTDEKLALALLIGKIRAVDTSKGVEYILPI